MMLPRLLAGPPLASGAEPLDDHQRRNGPMPPPAERRDVVKVLAEATVTSGGGAGFPVAQMVRSPGTRAAREDAVVT